MIAVNQHESCSLCHHASGHEGVAGPSTSSALTPSKARRRTIPMKRLGRKLFVGLAAAALAFAPSMAAQVRQQSNLSLLKPAVVAQNAFSDPSLSLGSLVRKRARAKRQYSASQNLNFEVNATPPRTCEPMNITFSTQGGVAPYTVFVGFSSWYSYSVSLPASYADADVSTWLYQFNVPVFRPTVASSSPTPATVVVVSDSTGNLMNSTSFQTVVEDNTSCAGISGALDFTFYNDATITACKPLKINWQYTAPQPGWKDPVDLFFLLERAPPVHVPITNSSSGVLSYDVVLQPGTNVMLTMTDQGGSGGVSGRNTVGGSEYVGLSCLTNPTTSTPIGVPSPTTTLSNLRMPDYTALVSSIVTDNGVVKTNVASETVRHGTTFEGSASTGRIIAIAVAVGVGAAIFAALASWCVWRKRHGRRNVFWDVPRSVAGDLSKERGNAPIDQNYLRSRSKAMTRTGSATVPMLGAGATSPPSEMSDERDSHRRQMNRANSDNSLADPRYDGLSLQSPTNNRLYSNHSNGSTEINNSFVTRPRRTSGSSNTSNPFGNAHAVAHPSRSYRTPFGDRVTGNSDHEMDSMAMMDYGSSTRPHLEPSAASYYDSDPQYGSRVPSNPTYVQHSDAGLLLDDSLENEEELAHIELPPQYNSVPHRAARRARNANSAAASTTAANGSHQTANTATSTSRPTGDEDFDGDDSKFWRSIPDN